MMREISRVFALSALVMGVVVVVAIVLRFPGLLTLRVDREGGQVIIDGRQQQQPANIPPHSIK